MTAQSGDITILHAIDAWLPLTAPWLYNLVNSLPDNIRNAVACEVTCNLDKFFLPNIHALTDQSGLTRLVDKAFRRLHIRPHLAFFEKLARQLKPQVLHSHFGNIGWANHSWARKLGIKHVVSFYGYDISRLTASSAPWPARYLSLFGHADRLLCLSPQMRDSLLELGCPEDKIIIHHLGIRLDKIGFEPRQWHPSEPLRVLIAGSFREKKGIPFALEALGLLQHEVQVEITLIGDAANVPRELAEKEKILAAIERHNLMPKVRMLGYQSHARLFEEAYRHHVYLAPSVTAADGDTEGTPMAILEMAATGMPVVSTYHAGIPYLIEHGHSGLLSQERSIEGILSNLRWLAANPEGWHKLACNSRKRIEEQFDAVRQGKVLARIYEDLIKEGRIEGLPL